MMWYSGRWRLEYARARLNYTSNKEFLEYVHLMALMDAESEGLLFDNPVPSALRGGAQGSPSHHCSSFYVEVMILMDECSNCYSC